MNILYYFEPWVELSRPHLRYHNLRYQLGPQIRNLRRAYSDVKIKIVVGEGTAHKCAKERYDFEGCEHVVLKSADLKGFWGNYLEASLALYNGDAETAFAAHLSQAVDGFVPDFVISFLAPLPDLSKVWPDAVTLFAEFGIFSRAPYPRTFYFDPQGMFAKSSIQTCASELLDAAASAEDLELLKEFRQRNIHAFYQQHKILDANLAEAAAKFECKLLLPLQFSNYFGFDACASYADQFEFLTDVLDSIPSEIGVFVTEHTGWPEVITDHNISYLRDRYPNLLWSQRLSKIRSASQYLLSEVDGVVTVSSSVGLQCMAWDKPLFSPWQSHLAGYSQVRSLDEITVQKIKSFEPGTYDRAILALLGRYYLTEERAYDAKLFREYLEKLQERRHETSFLSRFAPFGNTQELMKSLRQACREQDGHKLYLDDVGDELQRVKTNAAVEVPRGFVNAVDSTEVVSFDLFDTLVDRPFAAPHELYLYIQQEVRQLVGDSALEFHKLRRLAEHRTRQGSTRNEVSIDEIYDTLLAMSDIPSAFKERLIELEFNTELKLCRQREYGFKLFSHAVNQGKRIVCISDFYYGKAYLRRLLDANGYGSLADLYVSTDFGESKSEGTLFKQVFHRLGVPASKILHVGDNRASDVVNAEKFGCRTFFHPRAMAILAGQPIAKESWSSMMARTVFASDRAQLGQSMYFGLLARRQFDWVPKQPRIGFSGGDPRQLGYTVLGPLLFAFSQWLVEEIRRRNSDHVFFLSRDGRLFHRAYEALRAAQPSLPPASYLLSSRRAYGLAAVMSVADAQELIAIPFEPTSLSAIFESRFGVALNDEVCSRDELDAIGIPSLQIKVHPVHDLIRLKRLVALVYPQIKQRAEIERAAVLKYLDSQALLTASRPALVDIGYAGTIQHCLSRLTGKQDISGHYFMTHMKVDELINSGLSISGYFRESVEHHLRRDLLSNNISLFELLFSSAEQSLICFAESPEQGGVVAQTKDARCDPERDKLVTSIQLGALDFIEDIVSYLGTDWKRIGFSRDFAARNLEQLLVTPAKEDAELFNNISAEDGFAGQSARYIVADIVSALMKFKRLTKEQAVALVQKSEWRAGARAILPASASASASSQQPIRVPVKKESPPPMPRIDQPEAALSRRARLVRKLRRDPYQYFSDSSIPLFRGMRHFFR